MMSADARFHRRRTWSTGPDRFRITIRCRRPSRSSSTTLSALGRPPLGALAEPGADSLRYSPAAGTAVAHSDLGGGTMNAVLDRILTTENVTDGTVTLPLRHPDHPSLPVHLDAAEGKLLGDLIRAIEPATTLEIGMAYGVSTLYICDALSSLDHPVTHIVLDPFQSRQWRGIGLRNV